MKPVRLRLQLLNNNNHGGLHPVRLWSGYTVRRVEPVDTVVTFHLPARGEIVSQVTLLDCRPDHEERWGTDVAVRLPEGGLWVESSNPIVGSVFDG